MHILVTDVLSCPRCGPAFGLIVQADRIEDRIVLEGNLGCANCREYYPVTAGVADLRVTGAAEETGAGTGEPGSTPEWPMQTAALLGITEGAGMILLLGSGAARAGELAEILPHLRVVAAGSVPEPEGAAPGVDRVLHEGPLPYRDHSMRGVVVTGGADAERLEEAVRVLRLDGRLVVQPAGADVSEVLRSLGLQVLLEHEGVVVASSPSHG